MRFCLVGKERTDIAGDINGDAPPWCVGSTSMVVILGLNAAQDAHVGAEALPDIEFVVC